MFNDDQLLPISALQHLVFCERQCALIHVEQLWAENRLTAEGRVMHANVHSTKNETVNGIRIARGLWVKSEQYGLIGQTDVVEFHPDQTVKPVEYKRGKPKKNDSDRVQLCAQAICLEEMLGTRIHCGDLFYGTQKRRHSVNLNKLLRERTIELITRLRKIVEGNTTPSAIRSPKCEKCSLVDFCLPEAMRFKTGISAYLERQLSAIEDSLGPSSDEFEFMP